ncbi:GNAT family N-acetyltransferase [Glutamicibacter sp. JL.03c]|uniref:GNAT family N-acetyltransferase n=1 Tax=Glutamicibacter sp. JL.03c TaxID=2984842 RepID=UPI0021F7A2E9|nr:GNAT family N-acetyltransferase [Glutamicibacter sp. JL.03c]UYQ76479.1 GNAT family N-acetyltransferase [Glutamicibacter sp. JL.03c]
MGPNILAETEAFLADAMISRPGRVMTAVMVEAKVIGSAAIWRTDDAQLVGEMGYTLNQDYWGQGFATEIAGLLIQLGRERLGLRRIEETCDPENAASIRVLEKSGFARDQRRPIASQSNSRRSESLMFALG